MVGLCLLAALQFWAMAHTRRQFAAFDARNAPVHAEGRRVRAELDRLGAVPPVEARCFLTDTYGVGDRGLHALGPIDAGRVEDYRSRRRSDGDVVIERYLAYRLNAIAATAHHVPAERNRALLDYVRTRELMLQTAHRFFGDAGLKAMTRAYDGPQDKVVLGMLRSSLAAGTLPFTQSDAKLRGDIDLLLAAPADFIPCRARIPAAAGAAR